MPLTELSSHTDVIYCWEEYVSKSCKEEKNRSKKSCVFAELCAKRERGTNSIQNLAWTSGRISTSAVKYWHHLAPVTISKTKETSERWLPWQRVHEKGNSARSFIICSHSRVVRTVFVWYNFTRTGNWKVLKMPICPWTNWCTSTEKGLKSCLRKNVNSVKQCSTLQCVMVEESKAYDDRNSKSL